MIGLLSTIFGQLASVASIVGLYFTVYPIDHPRPWWHWALIGFAVTLSLFLVARQIIDYLRSAPKTYRNAARINRYMRRWVSAGGRVVILSRDMSWAGDATTTTVLRRKPENHELTIFVEKEIPLTDDLKRRGAQIYTYQRLGHVPRSRFTIVDYGREGARVAVGARLGGRHVIEEFESGSHPFFAVAEDLIKFLEGAQAVSR
jgi:hypothetical protein